MGAFASPSPVRRLQAHLWTGPLGHLLGATMDLAGALTRYALARLRERIA